MKRRFTLVIICLFAFAVFVQAQQIQNGNFENWIGNPLHPAGWSTVEAATGYPFAIATRDTAAANHTEGLSAIKLRSDTVNTPYGKFNPAGKVCYGSIVYDTAGGVPSLSFYGKPFSARPDSFKFNYKYAPRPKDSASVVFFLQGGGKEIGHYYSYRYSTSGNWVHESVAVVYDTVRAIDTLFILFKSSAEYDSNFAPVGSTLWVDEVKLVYNSTGIGELTMSTEVSLSPNPVSAVLTIWNQNTGGSKADVFDLNGRLLLSEFIENNQLNVSILPSGTYVIKLTDANSKQQQGRFIVVK